MVTEFQVFVLEKLHSYGQPVLKHILILIHCEWSPTWSWSQLHI